MPPQETGGTPLSCTLSWAASHMWWFSDGRWLPGGGGQLSSIPRDEKGINEWLYKRFQIKEAMYQSWVASDFNVAKLQAQKFE